MKCVVCALQPYFLLGYFTAVLPRIISCCHNKSKPKFKIQQSATVYLLFLLLTIITSYDFLSEIFTIASAPRNEQLKLISHCVIVGLSLVIVLLTPFRAKWVILEYKGFCSILEDFGGISAITDPNLLQTLRRRITKRAIPFAIFGPILYAIIRIFFSQTGKTLTSIFHVFIQTYAIILMFISLQLYRQIFKRFTWHIKRTLTQRPKDIIKQLKDFQRFYELLVSNLSLTNNSLGLVAPMWIFTYFPLLVFNSFNILSWATQDKFHLSFVVEELAEILYVVALVYFIVVANYIATMSDDIISFLFRYPISKLNPAEAAQVEMMIATFTTQKPILKASDIFTIGTRLLAAITGTVVTYVLVALQFHASWSKN